MNPLNKANEQANLWLREMMAELGIDDPQHALACLRAGLHALRDRLTVEEAAQLSAQLPLIVRGNILTPGWLLDHPRFAGAPLTSSTSRDGTTGSVMAALARRQAQAAGRRQACSCTE